VNVPLAEQQKEIYNSLMKKIPWLLRRKIEMGLAPNKRELDKLVPFLTGARMISNSTNEFVKDPATAVSPKINKAFSYLQEQMAKDKNYKALVYSNYLKSGVEPYKKLLNEAHIPYGEFTGEIKDSVRNKIIRDYNANKIRALIVSSAGGEGLDLKGTRLVQLLEPHFNNEKLKQVIGRAARYKSHEGLSPEEKNVLVQQYLSTVKPTKMQEMFGEKNTSTDEYLKNLADEKEKLNNQFLEIIRSGQVQ
jgi:SNF2 family DNA or RNA helicase